MHTQTRRTSSFITRSIVFVMSFALTLPSFAAQTKQVNSTSERKLAGDKLIVHTLNRLAFGARPGDIERVRAMGVNAYIEAQLRPRNINDSKLEARLRDFPALKLSNTELLAKYPAPGALLRRMQRTGDAPEELKELRERRTNGNANADSDKAKNTGAMNGQAMPNASMSGQTMNAQGNSRNPDRAEYRQAIAGYYRKNNLELPAQIMQQLQASRILRATYSERQLQEVMVDFWSNHFNVFANKGADKWYLVSYDRDVIRPNALGNFRDLLEATAKSPAMLFYLDNFQSVSPDAPNNRGQQRRMNQMNRGGMMNDGMRAERRARRQQAQGEMNNQDAMPQQANNKRPKRGINENYARELMELHTLGVEGGYTQKDIVEVARCFTGWTIFSPRGYNGKNTNRMAQVAERQGLKAGEFYFNPRLHDDGEKIVLDQKIPAGGGIEDAQKVLDILAKHPSTAKFMATKLARKFVMDNPTPELVTRVASAFTKSNGDIAETLRAVFTSPEFNAESNFRQKIKTPFELAVSAMRAVDVETDARPVVHNAIARMGEPLYGYQAPTGYPDTAETWVNTGALLERLNFAVALAANRLPGTQFDVREFVNPQTKRIGEESKQQLAEEMLNKLLQGMVSDATKRALMKQVESPATMQTTTQTAPARLNDAKPNDAAMNDARMNDSMGDSMNSSMNDAGAMSNDNRRGMREARRNNRGMLAQANMPAEEQEARRIIGLIIGLPEFQRQ